MHTLGYLSVHISLFVVHDTYLNVMLEMIQMTLLLEPAWQAIIFEAINARCYCQRWFGPGGAEWMRIWKVSEVDKELVRQYLVVLRLRLRGISVGYLKDIWDISEPRPHTHDSPRYTQNNYHVTSRSTPPEMGSAYNWFLPDLRINSPVNTRFAAFTG